MWARAVILGIIRNSIIDGATAESGGQAALPCSSVGLPHTGKQTPPGLSWPPSRAPSHAQPNRQPKGAATPQPVPSPRGAGHNHL